MACIYIASGTSCRHTHWCWPVIGVRTGTRSTNSCTEWGGSQVAGVCKQESLRWKTSKQNLQGIHGGCVACWFPQWRKLWGSSVGQSGLWRGPRWWKLGVFQVSTRAVGLLKWQRLLGSSSIQVIGYHGHFCNMADTVCPYVYFLFYWCLGGLGPKQITLFRALKSWGNWSLILLSFSWWGKFSQSRTLSWVRKRAALGHEMMQANETVLPTFVNLFSGILPYCVVKLFKWTPELSQNYSCSWTAV